LPCGGRIYEGYFDGNDSGYALDFRLFRHVLLFANPGTTNYNEFVKELCFKIYLNPWSKQECEEFAERIKFGDEEEWLRRFHLVGGKPRFLFSSSENFDNLRSRVETAIPQTFDKLQEQVEHFENNAIGDKMKHLVFSIYRNNDRPSISYLKCSSLVVEAIMNARFITGSANHIRTFLQTTVANLQSWRGILMEKSLLLGLATATFRVKSLEEPVGQVEQLGPFHANSKIIEAASEIQNDLMLYIPLSKTFPAIDGVLVVPGASLVIYAQSTVSKAHPIKFHLLKQVYNYLMTVTEFQTYRHMLVFIVSRDNYDSFTVQPYKNADGKKDGTLRSDIDVKQYVGTLA